MLMNNTNPSRILLLLHSQMTFEAVYVVCMLPERVL